MMQTTRRTAWLTPAAEVSPAAATSLPHAPAATDQHPGEPGMASRHAGGNRTVVDRVGQWWRSRTQPARQLRLVETLALGPKRSVALLELNGQRFLAGMGADGVATLLQVQHQDQIKVHAQDQIWDQIQDRVQDHRQPGEPNA